MVFSLVLVLLCCWTDLAAGQYVVQTGLKPDVRFDDISDRFDLTALMRAQNRYFDERTQGGRRALDSERPTNRQAKYYNPHKNAEDLLKMIDEEVNNRDNQNYHSRNLPQLIDLLRNFARRSNIRDDVRGADFAWHDDMVSLEGNKQDFEANLGQFRMKENRRALVDYLHGGPSRRSAGTSQADPDTEILLHYAVPLDMTVKGYLHVPTVE